MKLLSKKKRNLHRRMLEDIRREGRAMEFWGVFIQHNPKLILEQLRKDTKKDTKKGGR